MAVTDIEVHQLGQELFGEDNQRRRVDQLLTALDEANRDGKTEAVAALREQLDDIVPRIPVCPPEWHGWSPTFTAELLDDIAAFITKYVYLFDDQVAILAPYVLHTYTVNVSEHIVYTPYIHITAAERECGKTTLMNALRMLVCNPFKADGITSAAAIRRINRIHPTACFDELDSQLANKDLAADFKGILNSGFESGGV